VPAIRLQDVIEHPILAAHGDQGYFNGITAEERKQGKAETTNICSNDFGPALQRLGEVIRSNY
jgi:hypothetical protein